VIVLRASRVSKTYRSGGAAVSAVRDVSLALARAETAAIVGPSGSGKSTLLNLLGGLDRPERGVIEIDGVDVSTLDEDGRTRLRRAKIGLVFQFFNLLPLLSARENVALPLQLAGVGARESERRADELLERVGLAQRAHHHPDQLSGGEMQRVAVARALAPCPRLMLADEPTGNLDSNTGNTVLELLRTAAAADGCALLLITHDPRAAQACGRVITFADGTIVHDTAQLVPEVAACGT
jgi:putative ABC transport system ATP-binding protein